MSRARWSWPWIGGAARLRTVLSVLCVAAALVVGLRTADASAPGAGVGAGTGTAASGASGSSVSSVASSRGDRLGSAEEDGRGVFEPGPGQEYELAFFIAAAVLTLLVAGGFVVVIIVHGRGSSASDREATEDEIEA